jgi:hypothetical protein
MLHPHKYAQLKEIYGGETSLAHFRLVKLRKVKPLLVFNPNPVLNPLRFKYFWNFFMGKPPFKNTFFIDLEYKF